MAGNPIARETNLARHGCRTCWLAIWALAAALVVGGGLVSDGSRGSTVTPAGLDFGITGGTKVGGNLFHSFSELNLATGEPATFSGPGDVANIRARVTGGASSIDSHLDMIRRSGGVDDLSIPTATDEFD